MVYIGVILMSRDNLTGLYGLPYYIYMDLLKTNYKEPKKSKYFENKYKAKGTEIRDSIRELRVKHKQPICSGSKGYYFAPNKGHLERTKAQLLSRAYKLTEAANNPDEYFYDGKQGSMF